jgi:cytochrome c peroxidase
MDNIKMKDRYLKKVVLFLLVFLLIFGVFQLFEIRKGSADDSLTSLELLGKALFFDENLSTPVGQSCAACHDPETGFSGPNSDLNAHGAVYEGAVANRFGNRHPPTSAYAGDSPVLFYNDSKLLWEGGMFFDGRATGWTLGDPLAEQAQAPFLNPLEQNILNSSEVVQKVRMSNYAGFFEEIWGNDSLSDIDGVYVKIAKSIAAYERSLEVNPFTSKYDAYLAGITTFTDLETRGLILFEGEAQCSQCHISKPGSSGEPPLFTDFTYRNLGIPKNPENPFYNVSSEWNPDGVNYIDYGLGDFLKKTGYPQNIYESQLGAHKVPTLRNVDLRPNPEFIKSYGHNGYFKSLEEITRFYNTRDVGEWPDPEVPFNLEMMLVGDLSLTSNDEMAIVAFMKTLSDGYTTEQPNTVDPEILLIGILALVFAFVVVFMAVRKYRKSTRNHRLNYKQIRLR